MSLLGILGSCRFIPGTQANEIAEAEKAARYQLNDPDAGQFRNERIVGGYVCGEVNGKNRMGAYVGFQPFSYSPSAKSAAILPEPDDTSEFAQVPRSFPSECMTAEQRAAFQPAPDTTDDDLNAAANDAIADVDNATK